MLRDSSRYNGDSFLVQSYSVGDDSPFSEGTETDPVLSLVHTDNTGSAQAWSATGDEDVTYQLVPLVGDEVWASYQGGFSNAPGSNTSAFQRQQYGSPGDRIEQRLYPDHEQVDATVEVYDASIADDALTVDVGVKNWGPKPHPFWATIETKPPGEDWAGGVVLADERYRVGTNREAFARVDAGDRRVGNTEETRSEITVGLPADYNDDWDLRVAVWNYPVGVRTDADHQDERAIEPGVVAGVGGAG